MSFRGITLLICLGVLSVLSGCQSAETIEPAKSVVKTVENEAQLDQGVISYLSGAAYIVEDIDAAVDFYVGYLGFVESKRTVLDNDGTRAVFGLSPNETIVYSALVPANFSKDRADFTAINFAEVKGNAQIAFAKDTARKPMFGEPVMAFNVTQLKSIEQKMKADGISIIDPLKISPTGRSLTLTVLDPNGVRVQMYEMLKTPKT